MENPPGSAAMDRDTQGIPAFFTQIVPDTA
jgi:hypothetical protein